MFYKNSEVYSGLKRKGGTGEMQPCYSNGLCNNMLPQNRTCTVLSDISISHLSFSDCCFELFIRASSCSKKLKGV